MSSYYVRIKTAFRRQALAELKGAPLSIFICLALHLNRDGVAAPGIEIIMRETGYTRSVVCNALAKPENLGLVTKRAGRRQKTEYAVNGYAWYGHHTAPALWEEAGL